MSWKLPDALVPSCHVLSRDGERALIGATDGRLLLFDRGGREIWRYTFPDRVESVACSDDPRMFLAGTWGGEVSSCVDEGLVWTKEIGGVVGTLAVTGAGERICAGSWAGTVNVFRRDGMSPSPARLPDAVVALAIHASGAPIYAVLADHTLVALEGNGQERWRRSLDAKVRYLAAQNYDMLVATETGTLLWLDDEGAELRRHEISGNLEHLAASRDGAWVAWTESGRLTFWRPDRDQGFKDHKLPASPDALVVTGQGEGTFCSVVLPTKIVTFNRYRREHETPLPHRARSVSFDGAGTSATVMAHDGTTVSFVELSAVKDWLPAPKVTPRVTAGDLVTGQIGTITLDLTNEDGCRTAHQVVITIASEFLAAPRTKVIGTIKSGETKRATEAVEPMRPGRVPILVTVTWEDEMQKPFEDKREELVKVTG